jgi:beta-glucuronidase
VKGEAPEFYTPLAGDRPEPVPAARLPIFDFGRERVSLDGLWRLQIDPMRNGYSKVWWQERVQQRGGPPVEYEYDYWTPVRVPGDWNTQVRELAHYDGPAWYARRFAFRPRRDERCFLRFHAANYVAEVFLNGEPLGAHEGGFTPFEFEVTGKLRARNLLVVMVDATVRLDGAPTANYDWFNYGGLHRSVEILRVPRTFIRTFRIALAEERGRSCIRAEVEVDGPAAPKAARLRIPELRLDERIPLRGGRGSAKIPADPARWSPERPKLYAVEVSAGADRAGDRVGFRTVSRRGREILLNGAPVYLRGICIHGERPVPAGGRALSSADMRRMLSDAKDLGCNFVRLAHYPHPEEMSRLADRMGLMVWAEVPVYWGVHFKNPRTLANCRQQLSELVRRDWNRASVITWSVGNETPNTPERDRFFADLAALARRLDPTRLVSAAFFVEHGPGGGPRRGELRRGLFAPIQRKLDLVGINQYFRWYSTNAPGEIERVEWDVSGFGCPAIFSELGAEALAGHHGRVGQRWTEEDQADVYRAQIRMIRGLDWCSGLAPWILYDFRSLRRANRYQRGWNQKGLIAPEGRRKLAFGVLRAFYQG